MFYAETVNILDLKSATYDAVDIGPVPLCSFKYTLL